MEEGQGGQGAQGINRKMTILDLLEQDGITPKRVARTKGGEYASPCMVFWSNQNIFVIVESELDEILIHQKIGNMVSVVALGNAQTRPTIINIIYLWINI